MKSTELKNESAWSKWGVRLVPDTPGGQFRIIAASVLIIDGNVQAPYEGAELYVSGIPHSAASQLPYQPSGNTTLLDMHMPPVPEQPGVRSSGGHAIRLIVEDGEVTTRKAHILEFIPESAAVQPEV